MKVKALVSFAGKVTMAKGEVKEIKEKEIYQDLIKANYVEEVKSSRKVKADENK
ncbi:hypothetical protein NST17_06865 [Caldifermentibacillus hisashii]|uniref:Uncharacterized protein n=1 Tax=Caldifermentibacillus hisashii TaxID=996558 RepID=A0ABU9JVN4_9BACI